MKQLTLAIKIFQTSCYKSSRELGHLGIVSDFTQNHPRSSTEQKAIPCNFNCYDCFKTDQNILEAISWSADLDMVFTNNYKHNPTLSWQYFGSSTGFLRHFPGKRSSFKLCPARIPEDALIKTVSAMCKVLKITSVAML